MAFEDSKVRTFWPADYAVFAGLFVVSCGIGIFFAIKDRKKVTSNEFLVGGRQMSCGPVALSLTASFMSAVTVLGAPADVYRFGGAYIYFCVAFLFVVTLSAEVFVPVFYRSGITSTYEGGLKAVVWTDAFQMVVMVVGFLTVLIQGSSRAGGVEKVWQTALKGSRLDIFDFDPDPLRRHTFWTVSVGGAFTWLGIYGVNQSTIQRCISCKSERHAKLALYLNLLGLLVITFCAVMSGLVMYAFYAQCDPWSAGIVQASDQLMPYFVMEILENYPGLPGLFVACAFSGTLSTVAASINALATVTYEDFVKQCCDLSDKAGTWISKGLCVLFGVVCTTMAVTASLMGGIVQAALSIHGMFGGPMLGLFSLGILFPCTNSKGAAGGLILGITLSFWAGVGAFIYPALDSKTRPLPLTTGGCGAVVNTTVLPVSSEATSVRPLLADYWYSMSYLYYSAVGFIATVTGGLLITWLTGSTPTEDVKPWLIRPVCDLFCFWSEKYKRMCWCGVDHMEDNLDLDSQIVHTQEKSPDHENCLRKDPVGTGRSYDLQKASYTNAGFIKDTQL
ncbi:sodium-coupled monocarboxylate transporter 2 isoform X2 [Anguilla rostrata]|uniref:sodium-coupled monocarboxylate transporter 2 isoform X2 n=1 Tax=Anguilla rostrata TaxID=7938 RepID=UPI0030D4D5F5